MKKRPIPNVSAEVCRQLVAWRIRNGVTQEDAAKRFGMSQGAYSRVENARRGITLDVARLLVSAGAVTKEAFFSHNDISLPDVAPSRAAYASPTLSGDRSNPTRNGAVA